MHSFVEFLKKRLDKSLPGQEAQLKMAPKPVEEDYDRLMNPPASASQSSVLILLFPNEQGVLELVLTLRSSNIDHGGQLSFPGGRSEAGESNTDTALREAREEIGVDPEEIEILGTMTGLYVSHSDNHVIPVVGYMNDRPELILDPQEVEEAFSIELESLLHKGNLTVEQWELDAYPYKVPYWDVHQVPLWGATAMMLSEFLELYREYRSDKN